MWPIYRKEINAFFSGLIGYLIIGVFLIATGLVCWVLPDTSILYDEYATLDRLFVSSPLILAFLISAVTMRSFAEERQSGAIELLVTKPIEDWQIVLGKYLASMTLIVFALLPTLLYYYTVYQLGAPKGNLDAGGIAGSYIGLLLLCSAFTSIGIFASSLASNQVVALVISLLICIFFYEVVGAISTLPVFFGKTDDFIQSLGMAYHYDALSRGSIDTRNVIYFFSVTALFFAATLLSLDRRKW